MWCTSFIKKPVEEDLSSAAAGAAAYLCFVLLQNADSCTVSVLISCAMMMIPGATNTVAIYVQIPSTPSPSLSILHSVELELMHRIPCKEFFCHSCTENPLEF